MTKRVPFHQFFISLAALGVLLLSGCNQASSSEAKKGGKKGAEAVPVAVAKVSTRNVPIEVEVIGNVEAYSVVVVKARVTGLIDKVHFVEGDYVKKGQKLFTIDPPQFITAVNLATANVQRDRAQLQQARANLERDLAQQRFLVAQAARFANLQKAGVISKEQAEQYQAGADVVAQAVLADRAAIASGEAAVQAAEAAGKMASIQLGYTEMVSPIDGRTGHIMAKEGNLATGNVTEMIAINQVQPIYISFAVPEAQLPLIKKAMTGGRLPVSATPPDDASKPETGTLTFVDSNVDMNTGTIKLKGTFTNAGNRLTPGQFVRVTLRLGTRANAALVPNQAVQTGQDGSFVYRVSADNTAEMVPVKLAGRVDQDMIIDTGLEPGDTVVTEGQLRLAPGMKIRLRPARPTRGGKGGEPESKRAGSPDQAAR